MALKFIILAVLAVQAIAIPHAFVTKSLFGIDENFEAACDIIKNSIKALFECIETISSTIEKGLSASLKELEKLISKFDPVLEELLKKAKACSEEIQKQVQSKVDQLKTLFKTATENVTKLVTEIIDQVCEVPKQCLDKSTECLLAEIKKYSECTTIFEKLQQIGSSIVEFTKLSTSNAIEITISLSKAGPAILQGSLSIGKEITNCNIEAAIIITDIEAILNTCISTL